MTSGTGYIKSSDNYVYALDADTGDQKWKFKFGYWVGSSPAVADGTVYIGAGGHIYAIG